jgi:hypothetical protein
MRRDAAVPPSGLMSADADGPTGYRTFDQQSPRRCANNDASTYPTAKPFSPTLPPGKNGQHSYNSHRVLILLVF